MSSYTMSRMTAYSCAPSSQYPPPRGRPGPPVSVTLGPANYSPARSPPTHTCKHARPAAGRSAFAHAVPHTTATIDVCPTPARKTSTHCGVRMILAARVRLDVDALAGSGHDDTTEGDVTDAVDVFAGRHRADAGSEACGECTCWVVVADVGGGWAECGCTPASAHKGGSDVSRRHKRAGSAGVHAAHAQRVARGACELK
jgi:hypothetical protein